MSTRKAPENASGSKGLKPWMKNLIFAAVILVLAAALYFGVRAPAQKRRLGGLSGAVGALEYDQFSAHPMFPPPARHMHSGYSTTARPFCP